MQLGSAIWGRLFVAIAAAGLVAGLIWAASASGTEIAGAREQIAQGDLLLAEDRLDEAIAAYRSAAQKDPASADAHQRLGRALSLAGNLEEALKENERALQLDPRNVLAHSNMGWILGLQQRYRDSIQEELIAIKLDPNNVAAHVTLGLALASLGDYERAIAAFQKATDLDPENMRAYLNLGATLGRKGDYRQAIQAYRAALELDPHSVNAHLGLGAALGKVKDIKGQVEHFRIAVTLAPQSDNAHGKLGWALYTAGDWNGALREGCTTNWLRLRRNTPGFLRTFVSIWAAIFLLFGGIFAVIFIGSKLRTESDEIVVKSFFLVFHRDKPGRFVITNKRLAFVPEAFSRWFGAQSVSISRDLITSYSSALTGMRGTVTLSLVDGTSYEFAMPALVYRPLVSQLEQAEQRIRRRRTQEIEAEAAAAAAATGAAASAMLAAQVDEVTVEPGRVGSPSVTVAAGAELSPGETEESWTADTLGAGEYIIEVVSSPLDTTEAADKATDGPAVEPRSGQDVE